MQYIPYFVEHPEEFEPYVRDNSKKINRRIPKANVTKEGLQSLYRYEVECEDWYVTDNKEEMCRRMVEKFKSSECYKYKTEEERQEIIEYLLNHSELS